MRKMLIVAALLLALSTADAMALQIAISGGYEYQMAVVTDIVSALPWQQHTVHLDLRAWPYPLQLGAGICRVFIPWSPAPTFLNAVLNADYWFLDRPLGSSPVSLHLGAGAWAAAPVFALGVRGVAGLRLSPIPADRGFEVFLEVFPTAGYYLQPRIGLVAGGSAGAGIRYWFGN